jgi:hypothetical protein
MSEYRVRVIYDRIIMLYLLELLQSILLRLPIKKNALKILAAPTSIKYS